MNNPTSADVVVDDHFTIIAICPISAAGLAWIEEYLPDSMRLGLNACIEPRYAYDILSAMRDDGLTLQRGLQEQLPCSTT